MLDRSTDPSLAARLEARKVAGRRSAAGAVVAVLSAVALVGLGAWSVAAVTRMQSAATAMARLETEVALTEQATEGAYAGQGSFDGLDNRVVSKLVPQALVGDDGLLHHAFGGLLTLAPGLGGRTFTLMVSGLPGWACETMATRQRGEDSLGVAAGGGPLMARAVPGPMDHATARSACGTGADAAWVQWTFH